MHDLDWYLDTAKITANLPSDNRLARALDINASAVFQWRQHRAWPADRTMIKLAEIAGIPTEEALLELNVWRAAEEAKPAYTRLLEKLTSRAAALLAVFGLSLLTTHPADAAARNGINFTATHAEVGIMRHTAMAPQIRL